MGPRDSPVSLHGHKGKHFSRKLPRIFLKQKKFKLIFSEIKNSKPVPWLHNRISAQRKYVLTLIYVNLYPFTQYLSYGHNIMSLFFEQDVIKRWLILDTQHIF